MDETNTGFLSEDDHMKTSALQRKYAEFDQEKLTQAKRIFGVKTEGEALQHALDVVVAEAEIDTALKAARGKGPFRKVFR
jgi:hypothetical protein